MIKNILILFGCYCLFLQALPQSLNSGTSPPVIIDTEDPQVQVTSYYENEPINYNQPFTVTWQAGDEHLPDLPVNIGFSTVAGGEISWINGSFPNSNEAVVSPPQEITNFAKVFVKVTDLFGNSTTAESDGYFTLTGCEPPAVYAGLDVEICEDASYLLADATAENFGSLLWTTSGTGSFENQNAISATYTPSPDDISMGSVELCLTAAATNPCSSFSTDCMILTIHLLPIADAGQDAVSCEGAGYTLSDANAKNYSSVTWTTDGSGYFDNPTLVNPIYAPSSEDIKNGMVELCITSEPQNPCSVGSSDCTILSLQLMPDVDAGKDSVICEGDPYALSDAIANHFLSVFWSTSGDGAFVKDNKVNPVYKPGMADIEKGMAVLCIVAQPVIPCAVESIDCMTLTIQPFPNVNAGEDATICGENSYSLAGSSSVNYSSLMWSTSGDGFFDDVNSLHPVYTLGSADIASGKSLLTIIAEPLSKCLISATDEVEISILQKTETNIPSGWSGLSSYVQPVDAYIENVMSDVVDKLVVMYNFANEIYYPFYNINTLQNWDYRKGYFIKLNNVATLNICGSKGADPTLNLTAGWNIIPVLSNQEVPVTDVFGGLGSVLTIIKEIAGHNIYYPEFGIYTLNSLTSGKAYLVRVTEDCSITFPDVVNKSGIVNPPSNFDGSDIWGEIIPTPSSHQIIFPASVTSSLNQGDVIGAFATDGLCAGMLLIDGSQSANALTVYGDDVYTTVSDGLLEGQMISFKLFKTKTSTEFDFQLQFDESMNDGHFANNGISLVKAMNLLTVNEINTSVAPNIYPNPAKDIVNIGFNGISAVTFDVKMMNAFGEVVKNIKSAETSTSLDVTGLSKGVYYLRISTGSQVFIEKLILQ